MDRKRVGLKLDAQSKKELLELMMSHVKQDHMPKSLHELLRKWTDGSSEAVMETTDDNVEAVEVVDAVEDMDMEEADT